MNWRGGMFDGGFFAVATDEDVIAAETNLALVLEREPRRILSGGTRQAVHHIEHVRKRTRKSLGAGPAGQSFGFAIQIGDAALRVGRHDRVADRVERNFRAFAFDKNLLLESAMLEHQRNQLPERAGVQSFGDDGIGGATIDCSSSEDLILRLCEHHDRSARQGLLDGVDD